MRVEQVRRPMEADGGLAGARPALDDERRLGLARDQAVLVGLNGRDDVAHAVVARAVELLQQEVVDGRRSVGERAVERLVADAGECSALHSEAAAQCDSVRLRGSGGVERPCRGRLPVDDDHAVVVVDPTPPDVERILGRVEVEAAEAEGSVGIVVAFAAAGSPMPRSPRPRHRSRAAPAERTSTSRIRSRHSYAWSRYACSAGRSGCAMGLPADEDRPAQVLPSVAQIRALVSLGPRLDRL